jgi:hypothetical protein
MRGDSIRDFYAKTLALLGLGMLAGTGALVDYWPSGTSLPAVQAALAQPGAAWTPPAPDPKRPVPVVVPAISRRAPVARVLTVASPDPAPRLPLLALADVTEPVVDTALTLKAPPPPSLAMIFSAVYEEAPLGEEIPLLDPIRLPEPTATLAMGAPAVELSGGDDHEGLFTGVVKRTGTSIVRTGRKTGASIWDAVRALSGAVRKALPN